jgi:hypothetical protein
MVTVIVKTSYFQNYNVTESGFGETPHWKPKGSHTFHLPIETDTLNRVDFISMERAIKSLLDKYNSINEKYEFISYDIQHTPATVLNGLDGEIIYELYKNN